MTTAATRPPAPLGRRTRPSAAPLRILLMAVLLAVSACTGSANEPPDAGSGAAAAGAPSTTAPNDPDQWRRSVSLQPLTVPGEMVATADRLDLGGLVAGTAERPALLSAVRTEPTGRRRLEVSVWDGTSWQPVEVGTDVPGEPQDAVIAGNQTVAAAGGWTWESGTVWPYLVTSTDRQAWTAAQLPSSLSGFAVVAVAVDASRVVALARNDADDAATVVLDPAAGGEPSVTALPAVPGDQHRELVSLAVSGDTIVATGTQDAASTSAPTSFVSSDGGRTWAEPAAISTNTGARVTGVVAVPGGFVATGADVIPDDGGRPTRAAAWFSADGRAWQAESVPEPKGFRWEGNTSTMGVPRAVGGYVLALAASTSSRSARPYQRQPTGEWIALTETNQVADGAGFGGQVVPVTLPTGSDAPARTFVAIEGAHGLSVADVRSGQWSNLIAPESYIDPYLFRSALSGGTPHWRAVIRQRNFARFGDTGFRWWYEPAEVALTDGTLTALDWDPPDAGGADDVHRGTDGSAEVVLATRFADDPARWVVTGWTRGSADQPWQAASGFGADRTEIVDGVGHVGAIWLAWGRHGTEAGSTDHALLWYSTDGVHWSRTDGDFGPENGASQINHVCTGPDGEAVAVGFVDGSDHVRSATSWTADPIGRWQPTALAGTSGTPSSFSYCATVDGRLWISGSVGGAGRRWQVGADGRPEPAAAPDAEPSSEPGSAVPTASADGSELSVPQAVPGGFAATGRLRTTAYTGPVLWLSADGSDWTWVPVPTDRPDADILADDVDGDLVVLSSSKTASRAWRIPDIASVIASIPKNS